MFLTIKPSSAYPETLLEGTWTNCIICLLEHYWSNENSSNSCSFGPNWTNPTTLAFGSWDQSRNVYTLLQWSIETHITKFWTCIHDSIYERRTNSTDGGQQNNTEKYLWQTFQSDSQREVNIRIIKKKIIILNSQVEIKALDNYRMNSILDWN
jgi:hypothetical protein